MSSESSEHRMVADELVRLGFSTYEARTYVGLLLAGGGTGYRISNGTGVPQPKVYETLHRLVERGAAVQVSEKPARYAAVPPQELLSRLERDFRRRLEKARNSLDFLPVGADDQTGLAVKHLQSIDAGLEHAREAIEGASTRVYLHARRDELKPLAGAVEQAAERGVEFVLVHFGALPFATPPGRVVRHASTDGTLYASRNVRHLAVVVDSRWGLWFLSREGQPDDGFYADSPLLASLVKTYIRHDLFVQRIYADFPAELEEQYGPGLVSLTDYAAEDSVDDLEGLTG
ncbi:MAG TPA: helix-turn-helix domain-containing protein [Candidatus Dormibacteraeota bacterium]|nr:helix-turn-helix domain-containing protein [Candidatus Dormibacteraeota bacterium]